MVNCEFKISLLISRIFRELFISRKTVIRQKIEQLRKWLVVVVTILSGLSARNCMAGSGSHYFIWFVCKKASLTVAYKEIDNF